MVYTANHTWKDKIIEYLHKYGKISGQLLGYLNWSDTFLYHNILKLIRHVQS